jgi:predicted Fe-Mo cluster-binding NifX family protein
MAHSAQNDSSYGAILDAEKGKQISGITPDVGARAISIFEQYNIPVLCGAPDGSPHELVSAWMHGTLATGANVCDH